MQYHKTKKCQLLRDTCSLSKGIFLSNMSDIINFTEFGLLLRVIAPFTSICSGFVLHQTTLCSLGTGCVHVLLSTTRHTIALLLQWTLMNGTTMHDTALYCIALFLHWTLMNCTPRHCTALNCDSSTSLHGIHLTALHCSILHCIVQHCTALH